MKLRNRISWATAVTACLIAAVSASAVEIDWNTDWTWTGPDLPKKTDVGYIHSFAENAAGNGAAWDLEGAAKASYSTNAFNGMTLGQLQGMSWRYDTSETWNGYTTYLNVWAYDPSNGNYALFCTGDSAAPGSMATAFVYENGGKRFADDPGNPDIGTVAFDFADIAYQGYEGNISGGFMGSSLADMVIFSGYGFEDTLNGVTVGTPGEALGSGWAPKGGGVNLVFGDSAGNYQPKTTISDVLVIDACGVNYVAAEPVPEPITMISVVAGLAGLGRYARRRIA